MKTVTAFLEKVPPMILYIVGIALMFVVFDTFPKLGNLVYYAFTYGLYAFFTLVIVLCVGYLIFGRDKAGN